MRKVLPLFLSLSVVAGAWTAKSADCLAAQPDNNAYYGMETEEAETADVEVNSLILRKEEVPTEGQGEEQPTEGEEQQNQEDSSLNLSDENELSIAQNMEGVGFPEGAEQINYTYHGSEIIAARTPEGLLLLPVSEEDGSVRWYVYNENTDKAIPYLRFSNLDDVFVIIEPDSDVEIPEEFQSIKIDMNGTELPAWINPLVDAEQMYFVYAINGSGEKDIYRFDGKNGFVMRYAEDVVAELSKYQEQAESLENQYNELSDKYNEEMKKYQDQASTATTQYTNLDRQYNEMQMYATLIGIGLVALLLIFLIIIIVMGVKLRRRKKALAAAEERIEQAEQMERNRAEARVRQRDRQARDTRRVSRSQIEESDDQEEGAFDVRPVRRQRRTRDSAYERTATTSEVKQARVRRSSYMPENEDEEEAEDFIESTQEIKRVPQGRSRLRKEETSEAESTRIELTEETEEEGSKSTQKEMAGSSSRRRARKPVVEDLFEDRSDDEDEDDDFDVTDFKKI